MPLTSIANLIPPGPPPAVKSKLIATLLPAIEAAIAHGFSHAQIHEVLVEHGIEMELNYYHDVIYRLRKQRKIAAPQAETTVSTPALPNALALPAPPNGPDEAAGGKPSAKASVLSRGIGSSNDLPNGNISRKSSALQKFAPRNASSFDIKNI